MKLHDYPKIFNVGHRAVSDIFKGPVHIEEKIDGSQFSFSLGSDMELSMKTHHQEVSKQEPFGLFKEAMIYVLSIKDKLHPGWTYRGEVVAKPKHNLLEYERVPKHNIILFDVDKGEEDFLAYIDKVNEGIRLDLETVPYMYYGVVSNPDTIKTFMDRQPVLGGKYIEGVVIKAYGVYDEAKKTVMAKHVSAKFKEEKVITGQEGKASQDSIIQRISEQYRTDARWRKAMQRLSEEGSLLKEPQDIPKLRQVAMKDIEDERGQDIKDALYEAFKGEILKGTVQGLPDWYKNVLMEGSFDAKTDVPIAATGTASAEPATG